MTTFENGGKRVVVAEAFEQICPSAELEVAKIYAEGELRYGAYNWAKGSPQHNIIRHMKRHLNLWLSGDRSEAHLAKVLWGVMSLIHYETKCKCHIESIRREEVTR